MSTNKFIRYAALTAIFTIILSGTAFAYIDPGAGSNYLQKILAGFFSVAYTVKNVFRSIFSGGKGSDGDSK